MTGRRASQHLSTIGGMMVIYFGSFVAYHAWAESTSADRPHGVPAWYFMYPSETPAQRILYGVFYPCIRADQLWHDAQNHEL